jgi:hypothetical protein
MVLKAQFHHSGFASNVATLYAHAFLGIAFFMEKEIITTHPKHFR